MTGGRVRGFPVRPGMTGKVFRYSDGQEGGGGASAHCGDIRDIHGSAFPAEVVRGDVFQEEVAALYQQIRGDEGVEAGVLRDDGAVVADADDGRFFASLRMTEGGLRITEGGLRMTEGSLRMTGNPNMTGILRMTEGGF